MKLFRRVVKGFTLVELVLVIAVLGILLVAAIYSINPLSQFKKADDGSRKDDIQQIKTALDAYYNDYNCYPRAIPFGREWKVNKVVYMTKVPQDPACDENGNCYVYQIDDAACPQWNVLFADLTTPPQQAGCQLASQPTCAPLDINTTWACQVSGQVNCAYLSTTSLSDGSPYHYSDIDETLDPDIPGFTPPPIPHQSCPHPQFVCAPGCNDAGYGNGDFCSPDCDSFCGQLFPPH